MPFFQGTSARIYYRAWEVDEPLAGAIFLHGGGEHSGQFSRLASRLNAARVNVWAPDHVGHGISGGSRGVFGSVRALAADARTLTQIVADRHPGLPLVIGGHSLGGWTTAAVVSEDASPYAGAFLSGASLKDPATLPQTADGDFQFDLSVLAADPDYLEELERDPRVQLRLPEPALDGNPLAEAAEELAESFPDVTLPVLIVNGTNDALAPIESARHWNEILTDSRLVEIDGGLHNVLNDVDYVQTNSLVRDFVLDVVSARV